MTTRAITSLVIAIVAGALLCVGGLIGLSGAAMTCTPFATATASGPLSVPAGYDRDQMSHAATIVDVGAQRHIPIRGLIIAVATAMQESSLRNLGHLGPINDHDSLGLFQQRPSQGWGTPEQIMDPRYASTAFYNKLLTVTGWEQMPLTQAAQAVQKSAYPNAYAKHEGDATAVVNFVLAQGSWDIQGSAGYCGWTHPLPGYRVTSGYKTQERPGHLGVDLPAPAGTPILSAASGVIIKVRCNTSLNGVETTCDEPGSPSHKGCGWYTEVLTVDSIVHRYCHMQTHPHTVVDGKPVNLKPGDPVVAGQPIGIVGSSGHSYGPHLHFEVHDGNVATPENAQDPQWFMQRMGVHDF